MTVPALLVAPGALEGAAEGSLIVGAAAAGALLLLGTVPPPSPPDADAGAGAGATSSASLPAPLKTQVQTQTLAVSPLLPHGLSVVGAVGPSAQAAPSTTERWVTHDVTTGTFAVGGREVAAPAALLPPSSGAKRRAGGSGGDNGGGVGSLLPANEAFVVVRASMPPCRLDALDALLAEDGSPLLFSSAAGGGGIVLLSAALAAAAADDDKSGGATATATTTTTTTTATAASLNGATFVPLVDTTPAAAAAAVAAVPAAAPVFEYAPGPAGGGGGGNGGGGNDGASPPAASSSSSLCAQLDVLAVVPASTPASRLARDHLAPALRAQLALARRALASTPAPPAPTPPPPSRPPPRPAPPPPLARALHFSPPSLGFPVTLVYPLPAPGPSCSAPALESAESDLAPARRAAHAALGLPPDRPLLRAANALSLGGNANDKQATTTTTTRSTTKRLLNVHEAIPTPPPLSGPGVTTALVRGDYEYCHYLQDRAQDGGWGCAYRALQTLFSHFRLAGLSSRPRGAPSHRESQRALVALGDKPPSFEGSDQWIGAIECGFVLQGLIGVRSRVVSARRGDEVGAKARELALHFQAHGTPVMVGGGVLAYTLLGVQFDAETGESAFLILDPHYAGGDSEDDLKSRIVAGGWVGWKRPGDRAAAGGELFAAEAFYNFLCPMVPKEV